MSTLLHAITLPSLGLYYKGAIPDGTIQIKEITGREEAILYGQGAMTDRIDALINAVSVLPEVERPNPHDETKTITIPMDPMDLLETDRFYILMQVRKLTWGSKYQFDFRCDQCNTQQQLTFNIEDLGVTPPPAEAQVEPLVCQLPRSGMTIGYSFLRGSGANRLLRMVGQAKARGEFNQLHPYRYATMIDNVDGQELSWSEKYDFVLDLHAMDTVALREHMKSMESGIQTRTDVKCSNCGWWEKDTGLPLNSEFFRLG